jgi:DNA-directed RNA polymerase
MKQQSKRVGTLTDQITLEQQMISEGRDRYLDRQADLKNLAISKTHSRFMDEAVDTVSHYLQQYKDDLDTKDGHLQKPQWYQMLCDLDTDLLAYLTLSTCMEAVGQHWPRNKFLIRIGMRVEMEYYSISLKEYDKQLYNRLQKEAIRRHSSLKQRKDYVSAVAAKEGFKYTWWSNEKRTKMSQPLFNAVMEGCDMFETWTTTEKGKDIVRLGFTKEFSEVLAEADFRESWSHPILMPTITEPRGWDDMDSGCYIDPAMAKFTPLIRKSNPLQRAMVRNSIKRGEFQDVFDAINAIQRTSYKINSFVLEAVQWAWDNGKSLGDKFPTKVKKDAVVFPDDYDQLTDKEKKRYRLLASETIAFNRKVDSDITVMKSDLAVAKLMNEYESFWLPHNFDWRGRVYPIPNFNHHREDHIRSMFLLSRGQPLDEEGAKWVAYQCANAGDFRTPEGKRVSKLHFDERVEWTLENQEWILECARDFRSTYDLWKNADKPFAFLAAANELLQYVEEGEGNHICGLPINLDGSNSGTQHFAALGLNENDGKLVNLIPSDLPEDIYEAVASVVRSSMNEDGSKEAQEWLDFGIDRKVVKRPTMTFGYSATRIGFRQQIADDTMKPIKREITMGDRQDFPFRDEFNACRCLADHTWDAVHQVVKGASEGMQFFKDIAHTMSEYDLPVVWKTPIGFPVVNSYHPKSVRRVNLFLYDRDLKERRNTNSNVAIDNEKKLDKKRVRSSISPNIIHSLDSSHLLSTVLFGLDNDIRDFMLIHDSFATIPANTWKMFHVVRAAFVDQYKDKCIYSEILASASNKLPGHAQIELPKVPAKGNLDLEGIRSSFYCFS